MTILTCGSKSILFLHVPKCGGSSIVDTFKANGYSSELEVRGKPAQDCLLASPQHQTCSALKSLVRFDKIKEIFMVVRNPYHRLASEYNWLFRDAPPSDRPEYSQWVINSIAIAEQDPYYLDNHLRPMIDFPDLSHPAKIFRLEDGLQAIIELFLQSVQSRLNITASHEKNSSLFKFKCEDLTLDEDALQLVNRFYRDDFLAFGYEIISTGEMQSCRDAHCAHEDSSHPPRIDILKEWHTKTTKLLDQKLRKQASFLRSTLDELDKHASQGNVSEHSSLLKENYNSDVLYEDILLKLSVARGDLEYRLKYRDEGTGIHDYSSFFSLLVSYRDRIALQQLSPT